MTFKQSVMNIDWGLFPETYTDLEDLYKKVVYKLTGAKTIELVVFDSNTFGFEDRENPNNPYMKRVVGVVDPYSNVDIYSFNCGGIIYVVDEDETNHITVCVATDSLESGMMGVIKRSYFGSE